MQKTKGAYYGVKKYINEFDYNNLSFSPKKEKQDEMASAAFNEEIAIEIKGLNEDTSKKSRDEAKKSESNYGGL